MYSNNCDRGYEDAIPVKRSKRAERARSEMRKNAAEKKSSAEFSVSRSEYKPRAATPKSALTHAPERSRKIPNLIAEKEATTTIAVGVAVADASHETVERKASSAAVSRPNPAKTERSKATANVRRDTASKEIPKAPPSVVKSEETDKNSAELAVSKTVVGAPAQEKADTAGLREAEDKGTAEGVRVSNFKTISRVPSDNSIKAAAPVTRKLTAGKIIRRSLLSVFTAILLAVAAVFGACYTVAVGPSESVRNVLVLSALQASATKWVPGLFLDDAVVQQILADSKKVNKDVISVEDYHDQQSGSNTEDKWANAIDGMIYESVSGPTFKGYVLLVKDPSRVTVGVATDHFTDDTPGLRIFDMAEKYGAVAAINGGEYPDAGGMGIGGRPIGLTYSDGECVWNDGLKRSFMGFDKNNKLVVREGLTKVQADELGIRDGVCFQTGKTLITNEDGNVTLYYADNDTGTAQRTAIGQTADGTVILLVTDGRTASSLGATHNDVIDVMVSYGAISAGMLDGGSSSLMYYKDFYDKYGLDKSDLDEYQQMGLINKYKAFTTPRRLPTCFIVIPE